MFTVNAMSQQQMWEESCKKILHPNPTPIRAILLLLPYVSANYMKILVIMLSTLKVTLK